jgi:hypothetical protein
MSKSIESCLVKDDAGVIDLKASIANATAAIKLLVDGNEAEKTLITQCVHEFFDQHKGCRFAQSTINIEVVALMGVQVPGMVSLDTRPALSRSVAVVISKLVDEGVLNAQRGPGAGTARTVDCPVPEKKEPKAKKAPKA